MRVDIREHPDVIEAINAFNEYIRLNLNNPNRTESDDDIIDSLLDLLIMSYVFGCDQANESLSTDIKPNSDMMKAVIYKPIANETWEDRARKYVSERDAESLVRVAETETHRDYNAGALNTAKQTGKAAYKKWQTMRDERVRDTHDYLQSMRVPIDKDFYTFDNDHAPYPGGFELPENNINCRCWIEFETA